MHLEFTTFNKFVAFIEYFIFTQLELLSHFFIMNNIFALITLLSVMITNKLSNDNFVSFSAYELERINEELQTHKAC
jgi:hypothetical protein